MLDEMARRAEVFLVEGDYRDGTILAGFPWFADWGRDSMIAAPGLALATGRYGAVARVLNTYAALRRDGLLPNNFAGERASPSTTSCDAPLWFILAVEWFARARRNASRPAPLLGAVRSILDGYRQGTRIGIGVDGGRPRHRVRARPRPDVDGRGRGRAARHAASGKAGRGQRPLARRA